MKRIITSAGVAMLGVAGLQAAPELSKTEASKPWVISAALRGFYDDNYATIGGGLEEESFGFELTPSVALNFRPQDQTFMGGSYVYSLRYYEDRDDSDQSHQLNFKLDHAFSERYKVELSDSMVFAQEPEILSPAGSIISTPIRIEGDNFRNHASIDFLAQLTQILGLELGYDNTIYDYEQDGVGSRSAILDRMEHLGTLNLRWQVRPQTVAIGGYQFGVTEYTSDDQLAVIPNPFSPFAPPLATVDPSIRDNTSHTLYVGADHNFNAQLNASVRVGAQYVDYDEAGETEWNPYADGNLTYSYNPGSYIQGGVRHQQHATDVVSSLGQESTSIYFTLNHRITPRLTGSLLGQYQHSEFSGNLPVLPAGTTTLDGGDDNYFIAGLNLSYRFTPNFLAEAGYNYDRLDSDAEYRVGSGLATRDINRGYTRNRIYLGVRATF